MLLQIIKKIIFMFAFSQMCKVYLRFFLKAVKGTLPFCVIFRIGFLHLNKI